ncbi:hypothetical protein SAMN05446635_6003 [Burkholderia sp. OK233]|nr:hypothetical protein SAMN05446635_6003 [Burkholderia sp. OK233]
MIPYLVCKFEKQTLSNLVKECFGADFPDIFHKEQIDYIYRYLRDLGALSVLLEFQYVDKDYLDDFSRYYVRRFSSNGHKCARLHFFSREIDHGKLDDLLAGKGSPSFRCELQAAYLGFMVIKPLPKTFIGRTCLKRYPDTDLTRDRRMLERRYTVDLFGVDLTVDSIAFQEQDKVVSACATTAIWSALQCIPWKNVRDIPSCSEITTNAINFIDGSSNGFPNKELSNKQILRALDVEELRHHNETLTNTGQLEFFDAVRCHIDSKVPLILGVEVFARGESDSWLKQAGHAVTIVGYKTKVDEKVVYLHDDRLGPFAKATFVYLKDVALEVGPGWGLKLQRKNDVGQWQDAHEVLVPDSLIALSHRKVRLPYNFARNTARFIVGEYNRWLARTLEDEKSQPEGERTLTSSVAKHPPELHFRLQLAEISEIRKEVLASEIQTDFSSLGGSSVLSNDDLEELREKKAAFLTASYARFQWVATFICWDVPAFKVFFDATDIPQGDAVSGIYIENQLAARRILHVFAKYANAGSSNLENRQDYFYGSFLRRLRLPEPGLMDHLSTTYGKPRAPKYLKANEFVGGDIASNNTLIRYFESIQQSLSSTFPEIVPDNVDSFLIWAIAHDGALLIGKEISDKGHPSLTGFKPARIAGELRRKGNGWIINSKSGRYSKDYRNVDTYLENAVRKFESIFPSSRGEISAQHFRPE